MSQSDWPRYITAAFLISLIIISFVLIVRDDIRRRKEKDEQ